MAKNHAIKNGGGACETQKCAVIKSTFGAEIAVLTSYQIYPEDRRSDTKADLLTAVSPFGVAVFVQLNE